MHIVVQMRIREQEYELTLKTLPVQLKTVTHIVFFVISI